MARRLWRQIGILVAAIGLNPAPAAAQAQPQRIVAVGDLHGDYQAWRQIAQAAGLVDQRDRWAGGRTTLVQLGDITDRGPDSLKIIRHLMQLQREARRKGGRVVTVLGNHEAMNMTGDLRYVHPGEFAAFVDRQSERRREQLFQENKGAIEASHRAQSPAATPDAIRRAWMARNPLGKAEHQAAWSPRGELGRWAIGNPAVAKIGDTLFVHGGISARYAGVSLDEINRRAALALASRDETPEAIINDPFGPLWYRGLVTRAKDGEAPAAPPAESAQAAKPYPSIDEELALVLRSYGARRVVVAHTPAPAGIQIANGGRLIRIDTGISRHYGGRLSYLEIRGGVATPVHLTRPAQR